MSLAHQLLALEAHPWLPDWRRAFAKLSAQLQAGSAAKRCRSSFLFDQRGCGLGVEEFSHILPLPEHCSQVEQELITRFLLADLNNRCWFHLKQPPTTTEASGRVILGGPWGSAVAEALSATRLLESLSTPMLYGDLEVVLEEAPTISKRRSERAPNFLQASPEQLNDGGLAVGVDIGGTNLKLLAFRAGQIEETQLISRWREDPYDKLIAAQGLCIFLSEQICHFLKGSSPKSIGISWPGPVRAGALLGSVTIEEVLERGLRQATGAARARLQSEREALARGALSEQLSHALSQAGISASISSFRDAYCDAFGIAATLQRRLGSAPLPHRLVTLTLGTGVAAFLVNERWQLPLDAYLCEYGRVVIDMDQERSLPHRSTGLRGTLRGCLGRDGFARQTTALSAEALAQLTLELAHSLQVGRVTVSGGNADPQMIEEAQRLISAAEIVGERPSLSLSPVVEEMRCAPLFTTAFGVACAALSRARLSDS